MRLGFFTGLPLDGPDPECVWGNADEALASAASRVIPKPGPEHDHSTRAMPVPVRLSSRVVNVR